MFNIELIGKLSFDEKEVFNLLDLLVSKKEYQKACIFALSIFGRVRKKDLMDCKADEFCDKNLFNGLYNIPIYYEDGNLKYYNMVIHKYFEKYLDLWLDERIKLRISNKNLFGKYVKGKNEFEELKISTLNSWANLFSNMMDNKFNWYVDKSVYLHFLLESKIDNNIIKQMVC